MLDTLDAGVLESYYPVFVPICTVVNCSCWPSKSFFREHVRVSFAPYDRIVPSPLLIRNELTGTHIIYYQECQH